MNTNLTKNDTKFQFFQEASLSQKLADKDPIFQELSGMDPETANAIGFFITLGQHGIIDMDQEKAKEGIFIFKDEGISLFVDLLRMSLKVSFATSPETNEITKMGLRMRKAEDIISVFTKKEK